MDRPHGIHTRIAEKYTQHNSERIVGKRHPVATVVKRPHSQMVRSVVPRSNTFLYLALGVRILQGMLTNWNFELLVLTLFMDIGLLYYALVKYKQDRIDMPLALFTVFIIWTSLIIPAHPDLVQFLFSEFTFIMFIGMLAVPLGYSLIRYKDPELGLLFTIFTYHVVIPIFNMDAPHWFVINPFLFIVLIFPFWAIYGSMKGSWKQGILLTLLFLLVGYLWGGPLLSQVGAQVSMQTEYIPAGWAHFIENIKHLFT